MSDNYDALTADQKLRLLEDTIEDVAKTVRGMCSRFLDYTDDYLNELAVDQQLGLIEEFFQAWASGDVSVYAATASSEQPTEPGDEAEERGE